jgi:hypothetical protein
MQYTQATRMYEDVLPQCNILHRPRKYKAKAWAPTMGNTQLLCPQCGCTQAVESYDQTTGLITLRCSHQRKQQL